MLNKLKKDIRGGKKFIIFVMLKGLGDFCLTLIPLLLVKVFAPDIIGSFFLFKMIIFVGLAFLVSPFAVPFNIESNREYSESKKSNKTFTSFLIYISSSLILFLLIFILWGKELISYSGLDYNEFKWTFILSFIGVSLYRFLPIFFLGQNKRKTHAWLEFIFPLVNLLYVVILFYTPYFNLKNVLLGYAVAGLAILIISIFNIDYQRIFPLSLSKDNLKELGKFTGWMVFGTATGYLVNWGDNIVLKYFASLSDIGVYNLGYQFFRAGLMLNAFIAHYYTPFLAQRLKNRKAIQNYLEVTRKKTIKYVLLGFIIAELFTGLVIKTLFGPDYYGAIGVIRVLLLANLIMVLFAFHLPLFHVIKKYRLANAILLVQLIINLTLDVIFVRYWGILGAAIATAIGYLVYVTIMKIAFESVIKKKLNNIWSTDSSNAKI